MMPPIRNIQYYILIGYKCMNYGIIILKVLSLLEIAQANGRQFTLLLTRSLILVPQHFVFFLQCNVSFLFADCGCRPFLQNRNQRWPYAVERNETKRNRVIPSSANTTPVLTNPIIRDAKCTKPPYQLQNMNYGIVAYWPPALSRLVRDFGGDLGDTSAVRQ